MGAYPRGYCGVGWTDWLHPVLDQFGLLSVATANRDLGHRANAEPTSTAAPCSQTGWRCGHIEGQQLEAGPLDVDRGSKPLKPRMDYDRVRGIYRRFRPYLAPVLAVIAAVLVYAGTETSGVWWAVWLVLSGAATSTALTLGWRYRQEQPGGWWSWLGLLWACGLLLMVGAAAVSGLAGVHEGFIAALNSASVQIGRLPGVLDRLNVAVPVGVAGAVAALGGIGVLVPLGRSPLPDHIREMIDEAVALLLLLVAAMSACALLGVVARADPPPGVDVAIAGGLVPLSLVALAVPLLVGVVLRRVWQLLSAEAAAVEAHDAHYGPGVPGP